jgi:hypothetical protein
VTRDRRWSKYVERKRAIAEREQRRMVSVVYFVRGAKVLKIGTATNIVRRFEVLQASSPVKLELLGLIHGSVNVERWCHFQCVDHRSHYEWFRWNTWTQSFVGWVLAHGDDAATALCEPHAIADGLIQQERPAFSGRMSPLPQMKFRLNGDRLAFYKSLTATAAAPLGVCTCDLCKSRPWEAWR